MKFVHPRMFYTMLALLPLLAWFLWWTWRKREAAVRQFVQNRTLLEWSIGGTQGWQKARRVLLLLSVALLLLTMAQPQWGFTWEEATQRGRDIIVAIDTSKSMLAQDVQPNRLERAKLAALDLLKLARYDRLGVVAFAGTAFLQCPLTLDEEAYRQSVQILEPGIIPQGGTALSEAIETAANAFSEEESENHKVLILFTDGEDHEEHVLDVVKKVAANGMKIFTVGVGTASGELLKVRDENGSSVFLKDQSGNVVKSRLNEPLLQQIAMAANGFYIPLRGANAMEILYEKGLAPLPTTEKSSKLMKRLKEQYYWPLAFAIVLLVGELFTPERRKKAQPPVGGLPKSAVALLAVLLTTPALHASPAKALKQYQSGKYKSAYEEYKRLAEKNPTDARFAFNAGTAAYQSKNFDGAIKSFQSAVASPDPQLQQQSFYNLANSEYRLGEAAPKPEEKMGLWQEAVQHYESALKLNPKDKDAAYNKELVEKKLEELKKQQQQQQQQQKNNKDEKNKDDQQKQQNNQDQQDQKQNQDQKQQQQQQKQENSEKQDQQKNQSEQQQEQQKKEQEEEQKKQDQQQSKADEQKKNGEDKKQQSKPQQGEGKESDQNPEEAQAGEYAKLGKMTPTQAKQLLDAQKDDEKAMIFVPQQKKQNQQDRMFKDW